MTDPGALIRPDPREIVLDPHGPWPLCTDCKASHGASWGAVVDDATSLCLQHLDASTRKNYLDANNHENGRIDMRGCTFPDATIISDLADVGHVKPLILGDGACFVSTYLDSTTFHNMVSFNAARFLDSAQFNFVIFRGFADFQNAVFGDSAWFTTADFEVAGKFTNVRFSGSVKFGGAQFREFSFFDRTQFGAEADFAGGSFARDAQFAEVRFSGDASFASTVFRGPARFDGACFAASASFAGATFESGAWFSQGTHGVAGTDFKTLPDFTSAAFARGCVITARDALSGWTRRRQERREYLRGAQAVQIRPLRQAVEASKDDIGANVLFEIEMYLRSRETRGWRRAPEGTVLRAYELLCGYGTRPLRALCAWLGVILVAGLVLSLTGYTQPSVREPVASGASPSAVEKAAEPRAGAGAEVTASAPRQNQPWLDGFRSSIPGWTIDERLMTTTGRWAVTLSRILGAITLALFLLAVRAQVKR